MIRVRFHGRGGQGAKTASRIVGTAAFLEGFIAQDSPVYGAERRGAPMVAYARIARGPILERGMIAHPDLVLVADESLLRDPAARVLEGTTASTVVFVNTTLPVAQVPAGSVRVVAMDLTGLVLARLGTQGSISAPLGSVAARLLGLARLHVEGAVARELDDLGIAPERVRLNVGLAMECYDTVTLVPVVESAQAPGPASVLWTPTYQPPARGSAHITAPATSLARRTGDWRTFRPVLDEAKCNGCTLCFVYCPEAAIRLTDRDRPVIDYDHCKGCLLCVEECPTKALTKERETPNAEP
jgi:pyruvate ferredoxin oxidoreductase gamma subunit